MQDDLVMNRVPLPKYYDGNQWNTVLKPTRRCIPKYLHDDLPALKHIYIKQKFKEIGKFNCPKLEYFDHMIKNKRTSSKTIQKKSSSLKKNNKQLTYNQLKQQLQYALIIADKDSNVVDDLLKKAKSVQKQTSKKSTKKSSKNNSISIIRDTGKYFQNTADLVFKHHKKQLLQRMKIKQDPDISQAERRINNTIKLIPFQNS